MDTCNITFKSEKLEFFTIKKNQIKKSYFNEQINFTFFKKYICADTRSEQKQWVTYQIFHFLFPTVNASREINIFLFLFLAQQLSSNDENYCV